MATVKHTSKHGRNSLCIYIYVYIYVYTDTAYDYCCRLARFFWGALASILKQTLIFVDRKHRNTVFSSLG